MLKKYFLAMVLAASTILPTSVFAEVVQQMHAGEWASNFRAPSGVRYGWLWDANVWVDIKVQNLGYDKKVGVRWTTDDWNTINESYGVFEESLEPGFEKWGVDITRAAVMTNCYWCTPSDKTFEYAIFYYDVDSDETYWDNNNNNNYVLTLPGDLDF